MGTCSTRGLASPGAEDPWEWTLGAEVPENGGGGKSCPTRPAQVFWAESGTCRDVPPAAALAGVGAAPSPAPSSQHPTAGPSPGTHVLASSCSCWLVGAGSCLHGPTQAARWAVRLCHSPRGSEPRGGA